MEVADPDPTLMEAPGIGNRRQRGCALSATVQYMRMPTVRVNKQD